MRHAQRYWLEKAARECVEIAMRRDAGIFDVRPVPVGQGLQAMREKHLQDAAAALVRAEAVDRELARRKP